MLSSWMIRHSLDKRRVAMVMKVLTSPSSAHCFATLWPSLQGYAYWPLHIRHTCVAKWHLPPLLIQSRRPDFVNEGYIGSDHCYSGFSLLECSYTRHIVPFGGNFLFDFLIQTDALLKQHSITLLSISYFRSDWKQASLAFTGFTCNPFAWCSFKTMASTNDTFVKDYQRIQLLQSQL